MIDKTGRDVTEMYIIDAYDTLKKAQEVQAKMIVLKEYSPSCGSSFRGKASRNSRRDLGFFTGILLSGEGTDIE